MKSLTSALTAVLVLAAPLAAVSQVALNAPPAHKLQPNEHALNLPGTFTVEAPPAGFDPISASDEDLAYHGFPPRPNQNTEPKAFATWSKAMKANVTERQWTIGLKPQPAEPTAMPVIVASEMGMRFTLRGPCSARSDGEGEVDMV